MTARLPGVGTEYFQGTHHEEIISIFSSTELRWESHFGLQSSLFFATHKSRHKIIFRKLFRYMCFTVK